MVISIMAGLGVGIAGAAADDALVGRGLVIAQTWCSECHAIGTSTQPSALAGAPPFARLASDPKFNEETVRTALLLPHPVMPEFPVTPADVKAITAYIASLGESTPPPAEERTDLGPAPAHRLASDTNKEEARGRAIVAANCSPCHLIEGLGESPNPKAPAFATLSERYPVSDLAEALAEGIVVGHEGAEMPQFVFDPDEVGAIIAYLESAQLTTAH